MQYIFYMKSGFSWHTRYMSCVSLDLWGVKIDVKMNGIFIFPCVLETKVYNSKKYIWENYKNFHIDIWWMMIPFLYKNVKLFIIWEKSNATNALGYKPNSKKLFMYLKKLISWHQFTLIHSYYELINWQMQLSLLSYIIS